MRPFLDRTTYFFILAGIIFSMGLFIFYYNTRKIHTTNDLIHQNQNVIQRSNTLLLDMLNIETGSRGFYLTKNRLFLEPFNSGMKSIRSDITSLKELNSRNPRQKTRMDSLEYFVIQRLTLAESIIDDNQHLKFEDSELLQKVIDGKVILDRIRQLIQEINSDELVLLHERSKSYNSVYFNAKIVLLALTIFTFVFFILIFVNIRIQKSKKKTNDDYNRQQRESYHYSRTLIEASLDPLVTINAIGKITDVNEASIKVTGIERDQIIGTDFSQYFTEPLKAKSAYLQVFDKGFVSNFPLTIKHLNGPLTEVLYNASIYKDENGVTLGVFASARDITEQKLLFNYSLSLIEASRDPLFVISPSGRITDLNQATAKITELSRVEIIGSDFSEYFTDPEMAKMGYQKVFDQGYVEDFPLTIKDGRLTPVLFNGSVYKDDRDHVLGAVVVARVITEQKRFEKELTEAIIFAELAAGLAEEAQIKAEVATKTAEDAVRAKQQFLSNMSHEIRTPMNAIIGFTKVVLKTELTAKQKEYLSAIKMSGDTLIVLINDILDLAKVDAGKMTFEQAPFRMKYSIKSMLHLFEAKVQEKNLELVTEYDNKIPEVLLGDSLRLHQIILNLLSNAVKFTSRGKITIKVKLIYEDDKIVTIEFIIEDTGVGIMDSKIKYIFENFHQASSSTSRIFGGTGLGLAIVKQLVEAQGGTINVISQMDIGSIFSFKLNFQKTNAIADMDEAIIELDPELKDIKVLVVEDIALNQLLMKTLLDDFGFDRDIAANGKIAIERLQAKSYDIILMDLQMPEMNGFEATEYIRNVLHSKMPIIALTADVTTVDLAKCKAVGMNDYIAKPVDERILYSKIVGLVKKSTTANLIFENENSLKQNVATVKKQIDLAYLYQRTKSNPTLMLEMINAYLDQTPLLITSMKQSLIEHDWNTLHASAHKMIPSFSIMGMNKEFEQIAKQVQDYASNMIHNELIHDLVMQLEVACNKACIELQEEIVNIKNTKSE